MPRKNGRQFPDDMREFNCILLNEYIYILIKDYLMFVPKGLIINIPALI